MDHSIWQTFWGFNNKKKMVIYLSICFDKIVLYPCTPIPQPHSSMQMLKNWIINFGSPKILKLKVNWKALQQLKLKVTSNKNEVIEKTNCQ